MPNGPRGEKRPADVICNARDRQRPLAEAFPYLILDGPSPLVA
jgi:hypothetical protein